MATRFVLGALLLACGSGCSAEIDDGSSETPAPDLSVEGEAASSAGPIVGMTFATTGLEGAGFQNVVGVAPGSQTVLAGADVAGVHRSADLGGSLLPVNAGFPDIQDLRVASFLYHPTIAGKVYLATGARGTGGGFYVSTDDGRTWSLRSLVPQFSGSNNDAPLPTEHPRSTGNLIAIDRASGTLWAATFNDGVMRSTDDGRSWTTIDLAGSFLRGLALDPSNTNVLYAAVYGNGVFKTTAAKGSGGFTRLGASPAFTEELLVLGAKVYAAGGAAGVFASSDGGASWAQLGRGTIQTDGPNWLSIAGHTSGTAHVLYAGCSNPSPTSATWRDSIFKSTDSGATWRSLTRDASHIHFEVGGDGDLWWLSQYRPSMMLGRGSFVAAHISIDPDASSTLLVAGRSGIWRSTNGGTDWFPMVRGLGVTINRAIAVDPNVAGRVYVANTDWVLLYSNDAMAHVTQNRPNESESTGYALALDTTTTPSTVVLASGDRDVNARGEVFVSPDPATTSFTTQHLAGATGGRRPLGVAVGYDAGARVILAAVEASGVWRKAGTGGWARMATTAMTGSQSSKHASFAWPRGSRTVYLYDRTTGVWRSNDAGRAWTKIWARSSSGEPGGIVAAGDADASTLYVSVRSDGVYRLDNATSGSVEGGQIRPVRLAGFSRPGPITVDPSGRLWATELRTATTLPAVALSTDRGATWTDVEDGLYADGAMYPFQIAATGSGRVYVSLNGGGVLRGDPVR